MFFSSDHLRTLRQTQRFPLDILTGRPHLFSALRRLIQRWNKNFHDFPGGVARPT
jgi:hypothetical protein